MNAVAIVPDYLDGATASTGFAVLRPDPAKVDPRYLYHWVRSPEFVGQMTRRATGASYPAVTDRVVRESKLPVPPLPEQRRIAAVLDKADAIRRKRRESIRLLDELLRSAFLEMFGDPVTNEKGRGVVSLAELLTEPLRNGLSPAKGGAVVAQVLTLTAITGAHFESTAVKTASFSHAARRDQFVGPDDFLICRGNGNLKLIGRAKFPHGLAAPTVFPDTMIAARIDRSRVEQTYLETAWGMPGLRRALERGARTTSGIHKINQKVLASLCFPLPPIEQQKRYTLIAARATDLREKFFSDGTDHLYDSLVQRTFGGEGFG